MKHNCNNIDPLMIEVKLNFIDSQVTNIPIKSENKYRKLRMEEVKYSSVNAQAGKIWEFQKLLIKHKLRVFDYFYKLLALAYELGMPNFLETSIVEIEDKISKSREA